MYGWLTAGIAVEHPGGEGVACELFELGLESFVVSVRPVPEIEGLSIDYEKRTLDASA